MSLEGQEFPILTIQEERAAEAPRLYRPHTVAKPKAFDWDALTPTCRDCSTKTGQVNALNGLCPDCDPTIEEQAPNEPRRPVKVSRPTTSGRGVGRPRKPLDVDAIIEAYTGGQMLSEIATALQVGYHRVRDAVLAADIELRDDRGRHWAGRGCQHGTGSARSCPKCREIRNAKRRVTGPRRYVGSQPNVRNPIDEQTVILAYADGTTANQIARNLGVTPKRIRDCLARHGVELRDDRKLNSGGRNTVTYEPDLVEKIRHLYVDQGMTQAQVAAAAGSTIKIVQTIMVRHQIPRRATAVARSQAGFGHPIKIQPEQHADIIDRYQSGQAGSVIAAAYDVSPTSIYSILRSHGITERHNIRSVPGHDGAKGLKADIAEYGVPIPEIKSWALRQGLLMEIAPGIPPRRVFDAYVEAHRDNRQDGAA